MLVVDEGARRKPHVVTQEVQSPAELDVFVIGERTLVPPAHIDEHGAFDEHRTTAGKQKRFFLQRDAIRRLIVVELKPFALKVHSAVDEIDPLAGPVKYAACDSGSAPTKRGSGQLEQPVRMRTRVIIEKLQVIAG